MWIINRDADAVNLALATQIYWIKGIDSDYNVYAEISEEELLLQKFENEDNAKAFVEMLVDCLNGVEPIDYAFTWLKNLKAPKPAEPAETKIDGVDLVDGVSF